MYENLPLDLTSQIAIDRQARYRNETGLDRVGRSLPRAAVVGMRSLWRGGGPAR